MGQDIGGGSAASTGLKELESEKIKALVVDDVKIRTRVFLVDVPKYTTVDQIRYETKIEDTIRYNVVETPTTKFIPQELPTIKFTPIEEETIKYVPKDVEVERPVATDKFYERPVIKEKEYTIATIKDMENVRELMKSIPELRGMLNALAEEMKDLKRFKLVEQIVKADKVTYVPREEERIIWKDVSRERCEKCKGVVA